ncbi:type II toxin-antitoxin system HicA family toxin [Candidatus Spongiihabitans sp.]|uniref:type II toxin-antitoxin system HicA family toxin n=1 Tax=Candidatus Spongiihabitans sp. TaxID=3101308 RepID=UPI003C7A02DC
MKTVSGKELCKLLERKGWELKRISSSHHIFIMDGRRERISVPVHGNKDLKTGLQKALMRIAEIKENEL